MTDWVVGLVGVVVSVLAQLTVNWEPGLVICTFGDVRIAADADVGAIAATASAPSTAAQAESLLIMVIPPPRPEDRSTRRADVGARRPISRR